MNQYIPTGWTSITPRIAVDQPEALVSFIKKVFEASGEYTADRPTELMIGDSRIMIGDVVDRAPFPAFLYVYVCDIEATYQRAIEQGAVSIESPVQTPYGDYRCMIEDTWGNLWQIASRIRT